MSVSLVDTRREVRHIGAVGMSSVKYLIGGREFRKS